MLLLLVNVGCSVTTDSITDINQRIENRYKSFSTAKYRYTEYHYQDGVLQDKTTYVESIKRPDKMIQSITRNYGRSRNITSIWNVNTLYSQITPSLVEVYEYTNLPQEMTSYCEYCINNNLDKWQIPMEIADQTKYKVETSEESFDGKNAIKAVVTRLMSEEAKQKYLNDGKTPPPETVVTYWFDRDTLAILKEESHGIGTMGQVSVTKGEPTTMFNEISYETKFERIYEDFQFDIDIPDADFEMDPAYYPGVEFKRTTVDLQDKLKN